MSDAAWAFSASAITGVIALATIITAYLRGKDAEDRTDRRLEEALKQETAKHSLERKLDRNRKDISAIEDELRAAMELATEFSKAPYKLHNIERLDVLYVEHVRSRNLALSSLAPLGLGDDVKAQLFALDASLKN